MTLTIELPEARMPRTHIAARVSAEYVAYELGKLPASAWTDLMREGSLTGQVGAEFVGVVKWTLISD